MEEILRKQIYNGSETISAAYWEKALSFALTKIEQNIPTFADGYPAPASKNNIYPVIDNVDWTSSFWNGMLWQAYQYSGNMVFRTAAENTFDDYKNRLEKKINTNTHDLGFLYILSAKAQYLLTGNEQARQLALDAADELMIRYNDTAGILQAWGNLDDPNERGRIIVDCLMNIPLLFWASRETGKPEYGNAALKHLANTQKDLIRKNDSTYHTYFFDTETGKPLRGSTAQGHSDNSAWARGQAWGVYGLALNYKYAKDPVMLKNSKRLANYFLNRIPEDFVCYWDLDFTSGTEERDSSAAAIAVNGLLELAKYLPLSDPDRRTYENAAQLILQSLVESYTTKAVPKSNGILLHAVYSKPAGDGVDECNIWGDYFYIEALVRMLQNKDIFW